MLKNIPFYIGLRYTRAKRRNQFISFVSAFSLLGMALGVMALIIVLSVMNGFDREMKQRILSVIPHGFIDQQPQMQDWQAVARQVEQHPEVVATAPYIGGFALISYDRGVESIQLQGILPEAENRVSVLEQHMIVGSSTDLRPGEFGIVMGRLLARSLGIAPGDKVNLTLSDINITPAGVFPRTRPFTLVGVFEVGAQVDQTLAMIHIDDAKRLFRYQGVQGLHVKVTDIYRAGPVMGELAGDFGDSYTVKDWSQTQGSLFQAVKMEKIVIAALLCIIIAVAAFNIVSSLVLMVADKRSDIAVLRTLGLNARQVMAIFVVQGSAVGVAGTLIGALIGCVVAQTLNRIMNFFEALFGWQIFNPEVFFITQLPSVLMWQDVAFICGLALTLSVVATLYPAYRAAKIEPAEALRYE
ncbi:lipoprotein-releasing ABC transporter permease subunit [Cellvibrio sp. PSBB006]|uniref:lipoprotein-releasing ABC transporter permease subunit n=1 Tax=Cellvibrio sp. PSBB006 TaxID=1987723 RepID=UPI000B3B9749|nr:lipoprotein-releasing ABC transporter permease subunit [Cellvibrio sp. PSBB006]ARU26778.1 lipoprotein-releasing system transmembrane subunit LolC [Cellvibrio sp. PSBB006]